MLLNALAVRCKLFSPPLLPETSKSVPILPAEAEHI